MVPDGYRLAENIICPEVSLNGDRDTEPRLEAGFGGRIIVHAGDEIYLNPPSKSDIRSYYPYMCVSQLLF